MSLITPAGNMNFDWSPNHEALVRTASSGKNEATDKDALYAAAKKVVAQMYSDALPEEKIDGGCPACAEGLGAEKPLDQLADERLDKPADEVEVEIGNEGMNPPSGDMASALPAASAPKSDAVQVVQELADKVEKAEGLAAKVAPALEKVEQAIEEVKAVVGGGAEEVVLDVEEIEDKGEESEEGEEKGENPFKKENKSEEKSEEKEEPKEDKGEEKKEDDIVQKSCMAKSVALKSAATENDDFMKLSKVSPTTRQKVTSLWKDDLGYDAAYVKLMVTDYEK